MRTSYSIKGGGGKRQGPNDRLDESLGARDGAESTKSQSFASRRHESRGARKQTAGAANSAAMRSEGDISVTTSNAERVGHQTSRSVPSVPSGGGNASSIAASTKAHEQAAAKGAIGKATKFAHANKAASRKG